MAFQLPQRKRHVHFWDHKKRLNEKHYSNEDQHTADKQSKTEPRPALTAGVGENERRNLFRRKIRHSSAYNALSSTLRKSHSLISDLDDVSQYRTFKVRCILSQIHCRVDMQALLRV